MLYCYYIRFKQTYNSLCFERFFSFVLFERGDSLSFIYGMYGRENLFS